MAAIDIFCSGDDRHRVILLVDLLERAGQKVVLRCEAVHEPTDPCMVVCTRRALREPWIKALFAQPRSLVAVRLDTAPLPGVCAQIIDMQAWPARSADRKVGTLVHWLQHPDDASRSASSLRRPGAAGVGTGTSRPHRWRTRVRVGDRTRNVLAGLVVIALIGLVGLLLSLAVPDTDSRLERADPVDDAAGNRPRGVETNSITSTEAVPPPLSASLAGAESVPAPVGEFAEEPAEEPAEEDMPGSGVLLQAQNAQAPAQQADRRDPNADQPAGNPSLAGRSDALSHLCQARTVDAARAWAGVLNWKQRRRVADEPCVLRLIGRPGFEALEQLLDLP